MIRLKAMIINAVIVILFVVLVCLKFTTSVVPFVAALILPNPIIHIPILPIRTFALSSTGSPSRTSISTTNIDDNTWFSSLSYSTSSNNSTSSITTINTKTLAQRKAILLHLGAILDRGQAYNPTSGEYYKDRMDIAISSIEDFIQNHPNSIPTSLQDITGEWELVLSTVPHGIFRSSPFFLAIQEAYSTYADDKEAFGMNKADLFFKLHELQTCSWGISKVGRVAQHICIDTNNNNSNGNTGYLYSEFDTSIFSLTVIPIIGWFKLLPTFGGCVVTAAKCELQNDGILQMTVDYTTARPIPGLQGLGDWIWKIQVPVRNIWKLLPWNNGREPTCQVYIKYVDDDFRIVQDISGDYFVYTRPVIPRPLDLVQQHQ
jgi:hypothetical protein